MSNSISVHIKDYNMQACGGNGATPSDAQMQAFRDICFDLKATYDGSSDKGMFFILPAVSFNQFKTKIEALSSSLSVEEC